MDTDESGSNNHNFYTVFPPNSVNVLASTTNSGKTTLALNIINHQSEYFERPVSKVLIVLCNSKLFDASVYLDNSPEGLDVEVTSLDNFDVDSQLTEKCFLIFEDVQHLNEKILQSVNLNAHHDNLESVFIICQGLLGSRELFKLCSLAHRVILFFGSQAAVRLGRYLRSSFFEDRELKEYLSKIIGHAEKNKEVLLLELNQINGQFKPKFLAISGIDKIAMNRPAVYFPHLNEASEYQARFEDNEAAIADVPANLPRGSFLLVPATNVRSKREAGPAEKSDCEQEWYRLMDEIRADIESMVKTNKILPACNLVRYLLRSKNICTSRDGRTIMISGQPKSKLPLMDFVATAVRASGPGEEADPKYVPFARTLLAGHTPETLFKNKSLVHAAASKQHGQFVAKLENGRKHKGKEASPHGKRTAN